MRFRLALVLAILTGGVGLGWPRPADERSAVAEKPAPLTDQPAAGRMVEAANSCSARGCHGK
ncbi:MAG TPA: hypothetical protein VNC50_12975, partial [Planctomycetia bacterium]|nr:hypothetical protein [Planctomycetia bacterium]